MKRPIPFRRLVVMAAMALILSSCNETPKKMTKPPEAKKIEKALVKHGETRIDNYYWLNDREDPEVIAYLEAENAYTNAMLQHTEALQQKLFDEIVGRIQQTDMSVPYKLNGYYYYTRYEEGKEYPIYCRKKGSLDVEEEVMLDVNAMAEGFSYYQVGSWDVSPDNRLIAFSVDTLSRRKYSLYVKDLETGEIIDEGIRNTSGSVTWANDNLTYFYDTKDSTLRPDKIFRHRLGTPADQDVLVYHESDPTYVVGCTRTKSRKYLFIVSYSTLSTEFRYVEADSPDGQFRIFHPREEDMLYFVDHQGDRFYIRTNFMARNFRLMETPVGSTDRESWTEVIAHRDDVLLEGMELFTGYLAVSEKRSGLDQLRIFDLKDGSDYYIEFDDPTYVLGISQNPELDSEVLRFSYSSLTTPMTIYDFDMATKDREQMKQQEVLGGFESSDYISERLYAPAEDGVMVPISLVYRKGLERDGTNPLLIYGYGSYGYSSEPYFNSVRLSLLDRGFVYAIAHIRGGQEMGRQWYEAGKLLQKKNTFTDFIACTRHLIAGGYTSPDRCFAMGGSAGGLLMGAVINMAPQLYKGVIAAVPFVDVVTTMLDESIPLTTGEYDEWGNPNEKEYYDYMLSYSPYDRVEAQDYPALLVTTGLHDSQVQYWEPAKWVAKLRVTKTDENPLYLFTQMDYGHGGASGRFERYRETALEYAFMLDLAGISE